MIDTYLDKIKSSVLNINEEEYEKVKRLLVHAVSKDQTFFLLGEGVNSATADHFAVDLTKNVGLSLGNYGFSIKAIAMNQHMPLLTALANDVCQEKVYAEQLRLLARPGDLLIVFTENLSMESVKEAIYYAKANGIKIAVISGRLSDEEKEIADAYLELKSDVPYVIQDLLLFLSHAFTKELMNEIKFPVIFLDRDGVINVDSDDYIKNVSEFELIRDSAEAIRLLNINGYAVVVVTNQAIIGRGLATKDDVEEIHAYMKEGLLKKGAVINKIYYCPHAPEEHCTCRKPLSGLIEQAFNELPVDPDNAIMIGDRITDVQSGINAGIKSITIGSDIQLDDVQEQSVLYHADNLFDAVTWIIRNN